jgi:phage gpG-like protein
MAKPEFEIDIRIDSAKLNRVTRGSLERGIRGATLEGERLVKDELSQPGKGRVYGLHRASAPGDPPAPDTGRLRNSVSSDVEAVGNVVTGTVSTNAEYAAHLEFGTERIAPRPFMSSLVTKYLKRIKDAFTASARIT